MDVIHHHADKIPGSSGTVKAKYLGAFLYMGGYLVLVKVCKSKVYEPRHWFSLTGFEIAMMSLRRKVCDPFSVPLFGLLLAYIVSYLAVTVMFVPLVLHGTSFRNGSCLSARKRCLVVCFLRIPHTSPSHWANEAYVKLP